MAQTHFDAEERRIDGGAPLCQARRFVLSGSGDRGHVGWPVVCPGGRQERSSAAQGRGTAATKEAAKTDSTKTEPAKKDEPPKTEAPKATEAPLPPIPPEVQAKIDAARKAVAEAIVAAQDAGLVETSIDPPPILDILITGRATDSRTLKNTTAKKPYAVSPEVFGAWFTGYGKLEGINYDRGRSDHQPQRRAQAVVRSARPDPGAVHPGNPQGQGPGDPKKEEAKPAETKKADEPKKTEAPAKPAEPKKGLRLQRHAIGLDGARRIGRYERSIRAAGFAASQCTLVFKIEDRESSPWFRARAIGPHLPDPA